MESPSLDVLGTIACTPADGDQAGPCSLRGLRLSGKPRIEQWKKKKNTGLNSGSDAQALKMAISPPHL